MRIQRVGCACLLLLLLYSAVGSAQDARTNLGVRERYETADFQHVVERVRALTKQHAAKDVLVVLDIDNTLLAMNQDLGSDQWFNWQSGLLRSEPQSADLVAPDFAGLLRVQGVLFALSEMHPPEPKLPSQIKEIQETGVTCVLLTSRGPEFRDAAERELSRNGYVFSKNTLRIEENRGLFKPFDPGQPDAHGLSRHEIAEIVARLNNVTFANGIYMTAGQHKGYMLRTLLARAVSADGQKERSFKAIVFIDDHLRHTERMHAAFKAISVDLVTFRYSREDGNVSNFDNSSKRHVIRDWSRLQGCIDDVLVKRKKAG